MKTKFAIILIIIGLFISSNTYSQNQQTKSDTLNLLLDKAKLNNQKLFMGFGWVGCGWCRLLDKYHEDPQVNEILTKHFMIVKVDIEKSKAGKELYAMYGKNGTPYWTIFDPNGEVIIDSDDGNGNVGYPGSEKELEYYAYAMKKAAPALSDSECKILVAKLKEYRAKKNKK